MKIPEVIYSRDPKEENLKKQTEKQDMKKD